MPSRRRDRARGQLRMPAAWPRKGGPPSKKTRAAPPRTEAGRKVATTWGGVGRSGRWRGGDGRVATKAAPPAKARKKRCAGEGNEIETGRRGGEGGESPVQGRLEAWGGKKGAIRGRRLQGGRREFRARSRMERACIGPGNPEIEDGEDAGGAEQADRRGKALAAPLTGSFAVHRGPPPEQGTEPSPKMRTPPEKSRKPAAS